MTFENIDFILKHKKTNGILGHFIGLVRMKSPNKRIIQNSVFRKRHLGLKMPPLAWFAKNLKKTRYERYNLQYKPPIYLL